MCSTAILAVGPTGILPVDCEFLEFGRTPTVIYLNERAH